MIDHNGSWLFSLWLVNILISESPIFNIGFGIKNLSNPENKKNIYINVNFKNQKTASVKNVHIIHIKHFEVPPRRGFQSSVCTKCWTVSLIPATVNLSGKTSPVYLGHSPEDKLFVDYLTSARTCSRSTELHIAIIFQFVI